MTSDSGPGLQQSFPVSRVLLAMLQGSQKCLSRRFHGEHPLKFIEKRTNNLSAHRLVQFLLTWNKISIASLSPQWRSLRSWFSALRSLSYETAPSRGQLYTIRSWCKFVQIFENCTHIKHSNIILNKGSVTNWVSRIPWITEFYHPVSVYINYFVG